MYQTVNNQPLFSSIAAALGEGWTVEPASFGGDDAMKDRGYIANGVVRLDKRPRFPPRWFQLHSDELTRSAPPGIPAGLFP